MKKFKVKNILFILLILLVSIGVGFVSDDFLFGKKDYSVLDNMSEVSDEEINSFLETEFVPVEEYTEIDIDFIIMTEESETENIAEKIAELERSVGPVTGYDYSILRDKVSEDIYIKVLKALKEDMFGTPDFGSISRYYEEDENKYRFYFIVTGQQTREIQISLDDDVINVSRSSLTEKDLQKLYLDEKYEGIAEEETEVKEIGETNLNVSGTKVFLNEEGYQALEDYLSEGYGYCEYAGIDWEEGDDICIFFITTDKCIVKGMYVLSTNKLTLWDTDMSDRELEEKLMGW